MSLAITRSDIRAFFETGDKPTQSQFTAFINAMGLKYTETVTLVADTDKQVTHGGGETAKTVQILDSQGKQIYIS